MPFFLSTLFSVPKAHKVYLLYLTMLTWSSKQEILHSTITYILIQKVQVIKLADGEGKELNRMYIEGY